MLRSALVSAAAWGTQEQRAALRNNLGGELLALGRAEQAAEEFQAALALRERADFRDYGRVLSLFGLGDVKMVLGEPRRSVRVLAPGLSAGILLG